MRRETFTESLSCTLTITETEERASDMARTHNALALHQEQMKETAKALKKEEQRMKDRLAKLADAVHMGKEDRPVECREEPDRMTMRIETIRGDTGEVVRSRNMTDKERGELHQGSLFRDAADSVARAVQTGSRHPLPSDDEPDSEPAPASEPERTGAGTIEDPAPPPPGPEPVDAEADED